VHNNPARPIGQVDIVKAKSSLSVLCSYLFVRINPVRRFPCALCLQTSELYLNLIEALCYGPKFQGQVDSHDKAGGNSYSSI
jgi:hypothetical protein